NQDEITVADQPAQGNVWFRRFFGFLKIGERGGLTQGNGHAAAASGIAATSRLVEPALAIQIGLVRLLTRILSRIVGNSNLHGRPAAALNAVVIGVAGTSRLARTWLPRAWIDSLSLASPIGIPSVLPVIGSRS